MKLQWNRKDQVWVFECFYEEKHVAKDAGFGWFPEVRRWQSASWRAADKLREYATADALAEIEEGRASAPPLGATEVELYEKEIENECILRVEAGTNCPKGGDAGHGGRTVLRLRNLGGTSMSACFNGGFLRTVYDVEVVMGGDAECDALMEALEFALSVYRGETKKLPRRKRNFEAAGTKEQPQSGRRW